MFNDAFHIMTLSEDGSYTAYSKEYEEHYHSTKDGALKESLLKHVVPTFTLMREKKELYILDIRFGLGFNTLATLYHHRKNKMQTKLFISSPELDAALVKSLKDFTYPSEFEAFLPIIQKLSEENFYEDDFFRIELFVGDAREYVRGFENIFDIVYQDAFSPKANPLLWTREYFADIRKAIKVEGVLSTYSISLPTRIALYENGFFIYLNSGEGYRSATIASPSELYAHERIDMPHKMVCNPDVSSLN